MNAKKNFDLVQLLMGILSVALAYFVLVNPASAVISLIWVVGIFLIINGVMRFANRNAVRDMGMSNTGLLTFTAVLDIIMGLAVLFIPATGLTYIWIVLSMSLIMNSAFQLFSANFVKSVSTGLYWFTVIMAVFGIILGFVLLFNPMFALGLAVALLGAYFLIYGIMNIVSAF